MQRILNYGSSLQAHSLRKVLEGLAPHAEITYLDYSPGEPLVHDDTQVAARTRVGRTLSKMRDYAGIDASPLDRVKFMNHKRAYAQRYFPMIDLPRGVNHNFSIDIQVIGSDEVFNCVQSNANVGFSRDLFGINSPAGEVVSYAGSFGNTSMKKIMSHGLAHELAEAFSRFRRISVRDANSAEVIASLTKLTPQIHVDPTLVYDLMSDESQVPSARVSNDPYMVVYAYPGRLSALESNHISEYARRQGLRVICLGGAQPCGRFVDCSPFELLAYFRDAEAIVTDTFHGSIFAIINQRPFATITRSSTDMSYGNIEKLGYLLDVLGLRGQELSRIDDLGPVLAAKIDYGNVGKIITVERARAVEYLSGIVNIPDGLGKAKSTLGRTAPTDLQAPMNDREV